MHYIADITVRLKKGVRDPEGSAIQRALVNLGFDVVEVSSAKEFYVVLDAPSKTDARSQVNGMCAKLLANPIIHDYTFELREAQ
ncbi:MAG: phosphoribosylformylglycinamidine synthase subunit PurS [Methermicoccaceae archaeon]